jgi:hypothetical protein
MNIITEILGARTRLSRLFVFTLMLLVLLLSTITLIFNELKKQDISKSQLEIEKNRVSQIDKQLSSLYSKAYQEIDSNSVKKGQDKAYFLKQIEFLKSQRGEAARSIDEINKAPDTQVIIFIIMSTVLMGVILLFFSSSFKSSLSLTTKESFERISKESKKYFFRSNQDFLNWVTTNEIVQGNISKIELERAKKLKELYDISESLGDDRNKLLNLIISYTNIKRKENEIQEEKHAEIIIVFEDMQSRLKDECNRLNKHALINLFLCFFIAFILMSFIAYTSIFNPEINVVTTIQVFIVKYLPRIIAIISLLTMFLYFAKLYKTNIIDVKYYQNELTNIEMRLASLQTALVNGDKDIINRVITEISSTERNSIINKDQTTSELERIKMENKLNKDYLDKAWELLSLKKTSDDLT